MFLSNQLNFFFVAGLCVLILQGCGSSQTAENKDISLVTESKSEFPFSTKEPAVYQCDFVISNGKDEDRWFAARKGDKWRYDLFHGPERWMSQLRTDKLYLVDYQKKVYSEIPERGNAASDPGYFDSLTRNIFRSGEHREFDEIGRDGNLIKYKVRETVQSTGEILIYIDAASGMMVKQQFTASKGMTDADSPMSYVYEIRNLNMDVDDSVFDIPQGFKKTGWANGTPPLARN